MRTYVHD